MSSLGNKDVFAKNLKYYMELNHKSRMDIAKITNVPYSTVASWCNALYYPRIDKIEMLANYFHILKSDLVEDNDKKEMLSSQFYMCPVYSCIHSGQINWAKECIEGRIPIDPRLLNIKNPEEYFFLRINDESMNKVIRNGAYAFIHKQDTIQNNDIAVVVADGFDATLRRFIKQEDVIVLEPMSKDTTIQIQVYNKVSPIKILGKYVGKFEINS